MNKLPKHWVFIVVISLFLVIIMVRQKRLDSKMNRLIEEVSAFKKINDQAKPKPKTRTKNKKFYCEIL